MDQPKISVIVPVYKVEPYLRKCLDSIVNQTYQNLEIILVDDGSPDNCGAICDEYAARDSRIQVIHQENGGLSAARNAGLRVASGDYLGFVDSDDWIEPDMYQTLLRGLEENGADISICGYCEEYKNKSKAYTWPQQRTLNQEQALEELLKDVQIKNWVWDKLYRRKLFEGIWFPEGKTFEDVAVTYRVFLRAGSVACLPEARYHYLQREGSILADISLNNRCNYFIAAKERYEALRKAWPQFENLMVEQCVKPLIGIWASYYANPREARRAFGPQLQEIALFARQHYEPVKKHTSLGLAGRLVLPLVRYPACWSFGLAFMIGKLYQRKHGRAL